MTIMLPDKVRAIIRVLLEAGYEAYAVGGCVRDCVLGREPDDWDITTSAKPHEVKRLFQRTIDTGIQHGTVTVMIDREGFEVTTYRIDGEYEDNRHPKQVEFTSSLPEDLRRRDFTINAMAYNDEEGIVDLFDGIKDIERKIIRCVGDAQERFREDALRIMRAIRFSAQLGYHIEEKTEEAIRKQAPDLKNISAERIRTELTKLLLSEHPDYLRIMYETGVMQVIFPEFIRAMETKQNNPHHCYDVGQHILYSLKQTPAEQILRLAMLFHDIGKPDTLTVDDTGKSHFYGHAKVGSDLAGKVMRRLRFDNDTREKVMRLVYWHDYEVEPSEKSVRRAVHKVGDDIFPYLLQVKRADCMAQSTYRREEKLAELTAVEDKYSEVLEKRQCMSLKDLAVNGRDLIDAGMKPGKQLGEILGRLLDVVLEEPEYNTKEYLLERAKEFQ